MLIPIGFFGGGAAGASYELIASTTLGSVANFSFTGIPSTYSHLQLRFSIMDSSTYTSKGTMNIRLNGDAGGNYKHSYANRSYSTGNTSSSFGDYRNDAIILAEPNSLTNGRTVGVITFLEYANTNYKTHMVGQFGSNADRYVSQPTQVGGFWQSTAVVNSISIFATGGSGYVANSYVGLYGIKEA